MTVLITGGLGFIGTNYIDHHLNTSDEDLINLDSVNYAGKHKLSIERSNNYKFIKGSINDEKLLEKIFLNNNLSAVINFAAETHVDKSIKCPDNFINTNILFIHSNADNNNDYIFEKINQLDATYNNIYTFTSIERDLYLNLIYYCDCFIGNSSSGIYEVPLLKKITFNLGNRQNGRECGNSVIHIDYDKNNIINNINNIPKIDTISYPYITKNSSKEIVNIFTEKI